MAALVPQQQRVQQPTTRPLSHTHPPTRIHTAYNAQQTGSKAPQAGIGFSIPPSEAPASRFARSLGLPRTSRSTLPRTQWSSTGLSSSQIGAPPAPRKLHGREPRPHFKGNVSYKTCSDGVAVPPAPAVRRRSLPLRDSCPQKEGAPDGIYYWGLRTRGTAADSCARS